jgi:hypothetical protein
MKLKIEYGVDIIVGTLFQKQWRWYVTDKEIWILDQNKLKEEFIQLGHKVPEENSLERENILILDEKTVSIFLPRIENFRVNHHILQNMLREKLPIFRWDEVSEFFPSLFVNFDHCELWTVFPELTSFENYVPQNWLGQYEDFYELVPSSEKYWIIDGHDYFKDLL